MPEIDHDITIKEYYEKSKHLYPNIEFSTFEKICKSPFRYIKAQIRLAETPTIMIKYLGKFKVFESTIKNLIKLNDDRLRDKRIDQEQHKQRQEIYSNKLIQLKNDEDTDD